MAASSEDFVADPAEPFSPSIFLDLPLMPCPDGNGEGKDPASDDLGLPFNERMLMEEGIDESSSTSTRTTHATGGCWRSE